MILLENKSELCLMLDQKSHVLGKKKRVIKHWNRLPGEAKESLSLEAGIQNPTEQGLKAS